MPDTTSIFISFSPQNDWLAVAPRENDTGRAATLFIFPLTELLADSAVYPPVSLIASHSHSQNGYTVHYPEGLYLLPNFGVEDNSHFATQSTISSPMEMNPADFWITIRREDNPEGLSLEEWANAWRDLSQDHVQVTTVAGLPALQVIGNLGEVGDAHAFWGIITYLSHEGQVFTILGLAGTAESLTHYTPIYQLLLNNFRLDE